MHASFMGKRPKVVRISQISRMLALRVIPLLTSQA